MRAALRAWWELVIASRDLLVARIRYLADPCPPHEWSARYGFCLKCGERIEHGTS